MTLPLFEVQLDLLARESGLAASTLYRELKAAVLDGRLLTGTQLPPARKAHLFFGISRNTLVQVYERLAAEGCVVTRRGAGTFVAGRPQAATAARERHVRPISDRRLNSFWMDPVISSAIDFWRDSPESQVPARPVPCVDFRPALVDPRVFPLDVFRRIIGKQTRSTARKPAALKSPQGNQGNFRLRDAVAKHIASTRAVVCHPADIVVTSGAQQAFDILARALVTRDQTVVAIEDPGYPPMRVAFAAAGARLVPVRVDAEGLCVEDLPEDAGVICVCPSHQFPLGVTMSVRRRKSLVEFARHRGAVIVEDDYDGEFRYDTTPSAALRSSKDADVVFYVGTFSKCMMPSLRLGYIVAPVWSLSTLVTIKNGLDWHCSTLIQSAVAGFIAEGHLLRHVRRMRNIYGKRRALLLGILHSEFGEWLRPVPSGYGMHIAVVARNTVDWEAVTAALLMHNVRIHTLRRYFLGPPTTTGLLLGYGAPNLTELRQGADALKAVLED